LTMAADGGAVRVRRRRRLRRLGFWGDGGAALRGSALNRPDRGRDRLAWGPRATRRTAGGLGDEPESETAGSGG
jgi:hypothetical protein